MMLMGRHRRSYPAATGKTGRGGNAAAAVPPVSESTRAPDSVKRILYVESGITGGGSFASLLLNLACIDRREYTPIAVFLNDTPYREKAEELGVATYLFSHPLYSKHRGYRTRFYRFLLRASAYYAPALYLSVYGAIHHRLIRSLEEIVFRQRVDIIHLNNNVVRDLYGVLASRRTRTACVSHLRGAPGQQAHPRRVNALANHAVSTYVAISGYMRELWTSYGIDPEKCRIVHNGIAPLDIDSLDVRREFGLGGVDTVICSIGRLIEWKNHAFLLKGFAEYSRANPSSALLLVGEGPERESLERLARELGVAPSVRFVGHSDRAREILAGSDIFVLPSRGEPFGRVTLEAMALNVPVVAARSGASGELVRDKKTGLLVTLNDTNELRNALQALATDGDLRERLAANAYESTKGQFHIANSVAALEKIYRAIEAPCDGREGVATVPGHTWSSHDVV